MSTIDNQLIPPTRRIGLFRLTPERLVFGLLFLEASLLICDHFYWIAKGWAVLTAVGAIAVAFLFMLFWFGLSLFTRVRFQFSIRCLLALFVVVAIACSWMTTALKKAWEQRQAISAIDGADANGVFIWSSHSPELYYDYLYEPTDILRSRKAEPLSPEWLRHILGYDFFSDIVFVSTSDPDPLFSHLSAFPRLRGIDLWNSRLSDANASRLKELPDLEEVRLPDTDVSDAGLRQIASLTHLRTLSIYVCSKTEMEYINGLTKLQKLTLTHSVAGDTDMFQVMNLKQLRELDLSSSWIYDKALSNIKGLCQLEKLRLGQSVTDQGLECLRGLARLKELGINSNAVTDEGLKTLARLEHLEVLDLAGTKITNDGLEYVKGFTRLTKLNLRGTKVTYEGVARLRNALPNCEIETDYLTPPEPCPPTVIETGGR